ncbi:hypothetical protein MMC24_000546 [Lignoscripta atroalba]|nr:hypothetical protein [Lignoscripta atroalba]
MPREAEATVPIPKDIQIRNGWPGIIQWTAIGDSYATGVGVGDSLEWARCVRYSDAYPLLMNVDKRMPGKSEDRRIWNCACSGATGQDILDNQFLDVPTASPIYGARPEFGAPQIATLTAGGDDVSFLNLIWFCMYQFTTSKSCPQQIADSYKLLRDDKWKNTMDLVVKTALEKGQKAAGPGFKLFVTGYAYFFNSETTQCNDVTFSYFTRKKPVKLTQELRRELNALTEELNQKIKSVVDGNDGAIFVDYNEKFKDHRYCEEGVKEIDADNPDIWFFHLNTKGNGRTKALDDKLMAKLDKDGDAAHFQAMLDKDDDEPFGIDPQDSKAAWDLLFSVADGQDASIQSGVAGWVRGFHPTRPGIDAIVTEIFKKFPDWPDPSTRKCKRGKTSSKSR